MITLCLGKKLGDPSRSIKSYWPTLRTLWNGKKVPNIPPLLVITGLEIIIFQCSDMLSKYARIYVHHFSFKSVSKFSITNNKNNKFFLSCREILY